MISKGVVQSWLDRGSGWTDSAPDCPCAVLTSRPFVSVCFCLQYVYSYYCNMCSKIRLCPSLDNDKIGGGNIHTCTR